MNFAERDNPLTDHTMQMSWDRNEWQTICVCRAISLQATLCVTVCVCVMGCCIFHPVRSLNYFQTNNHFFLNIFTLKWSWNVGGPFWTARSVLVLATAEVHLGGRTWRLVALPVEGGKTHGLGQHVAYLHLLCLVRSTTHLRCMAASFPEHSVVYCAWHSLQKSRNITWLNCFGFFLHLQFFEQ